MPNFTVKRRVSLAGISDDWDDRCHILVKPLKLEDMAKESANLKDEQLIQMAIDRVKSNFVSGQVLGDDGNMVDLKSADDLDPFILVALDRIKDAMTGEDLKKSTS